MTIVTTSFNYLQLTGIQSLSTLIWWLCFVLSEQVCFSANQLVDIFALEPHSLISKEHFRQICPAIVQQLLGDACGSTKRPARGAPPTAVESKTSSLIGPPLLCLCRQTAVITGKQQRKVIGRDWSWMTFIWPCVPCVVFPFLIYFFPLSWLLAAIVLLWKSLCSEMEE